MIFVCMSAVVQLQQVEGVQPYIGHEGKTMSQAVGPLTSLTVV